MVTNGEQGLDEVSGGHVSRKGDIGQAGFSPFLRGANVDQDDLAGNGFGAGLVGGHLRHLGGGTGGEGNDEGEEGGDKTHGGLLLNRYSVDCI